MFKSIIGSAVTLTLLSVGSIATAPSAEAWGKFGHLTVCDLAYRNLTETSREELKRLFHDDEGGIQVEGRGRAKDRYYTSFNVGCVEEDAIPRRHPEDHFVNFPRDVLTVNGPSCPLQGSCIMAGIDRDLGILADENESDEDRVFALMAVGHWVGDIHQPLHVSFKDDRGGNRIGAKVDGKCGTYSFKSDNLHAIWDNCLLDAGLFEKVRNMPGYKRKWSRYTITYRAVDNLLFGVSPADEAEWVKGEPWEWAAESYAITLDPDVRYCVMVNNKCRYKEDRVKYKKSAKRREVIGQDYIEQYKDVAERRIQLAGFRLAHLINQALDPNYVSPIDMGPAAPVE